ncbi:hypothetical protein, partial [Bartonella sp. TP]|uniref:hypothetical protein n=1 Tax=Bartonella sp. TP TaxID=3057550 RepID=UPI0025AEFAE7
GKDSKTYVAIFSTNVAGVHSLTAHYLETLINTNPSDVAVINLPNFTEAELTANKKAVNADDKDKLLLTLKLPNIKENVASKLRLVDNGEAVASPVFTVQQGNLATYTTNFSSTKAGKHSLSVNYDGKPINKAIVDIDVSAENNAVAVDTIKTEPDPRIIYVGTFSHGQKITFTLKDKYGNLLPNKKVSLLIRNPEYWEIKPLEVISNVNGECSFNVRWKVEVNPYDSDSFDFGLIVGNQNIPSIGHLYLRRDTPASGYSEMNLTPEFATLDSNGEAVVEFYLRLLNADHMPIIDDISADLSILDNAKVTDSHITVTCTGKQSSYDGECSIYTGTFKVHKAGTHDIGIAYSKDSDGASHLAKLTELIVRDPALESSTLTPQSSIISDAGSTDIDIAVANRNDIKLSDIKPVLKSPSNAELNTNYSFSAVTKGSVAGHYKFTFKPLRAVSEDANFVIGIEIYGVASKNTATIKVQHQKLTNATLAVMPPKVVDNKLTSNITLNLPNVSDDIASRLSLYDGTQKIADFKKGKDSKTYVAIFSTNVAGVHSLTAHYLETLINTNPSDVAVINLPNFTEAELTANKKAVNADDKDKLLLTLKLPNIKENVASKLRLVDSANTDKELSAFEAQSGNVTTYTATFSTYKSGLHNLSVQYDGKLIHNAAIDIEASAENNAISEQKSAVTPAAGIYMGNFSPAVDIVFTLRDQYGNLLPNKNVSFLIDEPTQWEINPSAQVTTTIEGEAKFHVKWKNISKFRSDGYKFGIKTAKTNSVNDLIFGDIVISSDVPSAQMSHMTFDPPNPALTSEGSVDEAKVNFTLTLNNFDNGPIRDDIHGDLKIVDNNKVIPATIVSHCTGGPENRNCSKYTGTFTIHQAGKHDIGIHYLKDSGLDDVLKVLGHLNVSGPEINKSPANSSFGDNK